MEATERGGSRLHEPSNQRPSRTYDIRIIEHSLQMVLVDDQPEDSADRGVVTRLERDPTVAAIGTDLRHAS